MRIICAVSTPFQVNFFHELVRRRPGEEYLFAARDRDVTLSMLEDKGLEHVNLGGYKGSSLDMKLKEFANSLISMGDLVDDYDPDLVLTERYPPAVHVAHLADIPCWTIFNDEREFHVNRMTHPLASRVLVPSFYEFETIQGQGVTDKDKIIWFNGFITCYLKGAEIPQIDPFQHLQLNHEQAPLILVRPEFEFSVFFDSYEPILEEVVERMLSRMDLNIVVLPRTAEQRERYRRIGAIIPESSLPGNPIAHSDLVMGSAETMLCEAFTLGVPALSCIYWDLTVPMQVLHRHIPRSTDPREVCDLATDLLDQDSGKEYQRRSQEVIGSMEDPVDIIDSLLDSDIGA